MKNENKHLIISGILFTIVLLLWPVLMAVAQPTGTDLEHLKWIENHLTIHKLQFFCAFLIGPAIVYMMIAQLNKYAYKSQIQSKLGYVFLTSYVVFISISYASQFIVLPRLLESKSMELARFMYFNSSISLPYFLNQTGYMFWAATAIVLFYPLLTEKGIIKYISIIYIISAILSFIAFTGLIIQHDKLNSLTLVSGLVLIPVGILTIIWGIRENKQSS